MYELSEKSVSKSQRRLMGMAWAYRKGELDIDKVPKEIRQEIIDIANSKSFKDKSLRKFAKTKEKGLPKKVRTKKGKPDMRLKKNKNKVGKKYEHLLTYQEFLLEMKKDELISDADEDRVKRSENLNVSYRKTKFRHKKKYVKTITFDVDSENSNKKYQVYIQIPDYKIISKLRKESISDKFELVIEDGDINIHCTCPDFLYKGYEYMANQLGYSIEDEHRFPNIRNPKLKGTLCKHCLAVLNNIEDYKDDIVNDIETYLKKERERKRKYKKNK